MSSTDDCETQELIICENVVDSKDHSNPPTASPENTILGRRKKPPRRNPPQHYSQGSYSLRSNKPKHGGEKRRNSAPINSFQKPEERTDHKKTQSAICENNLGGLNERDRKQEEYEKVICYVGDVTPETASLKSNGSLKRPRTPRRQMSTVSVASHLSEVSNERDIEAPVHQLAGETYVAEDTVMNIDFNKLEENVNKGEKEEEIRKANKKLLRDNLSASLSGVYGIFLVVMGAVLPITETFSAEPSPYMFEMFYIYLYVICILFIGYIYLVIHRMRSVIPQCIGRLLARLHMNVREDDPDKTKSCDNNNENDEALPESHVNDNEAYSNTEMNLHIGSFPLKLGAVGFGIASMIHSGLYFGQYFQIRDGSAVCHNPVHAIKPFIHLVFTFVQLYFIFINFKINIKSNLILVRFGLMHMCCTNICVWLRCIVVETLHAVSLRKPSGHGGIGIEVMLPRRRNSTVFIPEISCAWTELFGKVVDDAAPYLYPCKIEYSLICAGILIVMWKNLGVVDSPSKSNSANHKRDNGKKDSKDFNCQSSSRGLFAGILVTVGAIITMIAFYVLSSNAEMDSTAIVLVHLSETSMYILTTFAIVLAADRMKNLKFHINFECGIEEPLILISFFGLFMFAVFNVIAAAFEIHKPDGVLSILTNIFMIVQSTIQTLFIIAASKVSAVTTEQEHKKRGRQFIAFLILCNFSMWAMHTFETQKPEHNPVQMDFYGPLAWSIFTHITVPLGIYFRFHSAVCLTNIWKNAWTMHLPHRSVSRALLHDKEKV